MYTVHKLKCEISIFEVRLAVSIRYEGLFLHLPSAVDYLLKILNWDMYKEFYFISLSCKKGQNYTINCRINHNEIKQKMLAYDILVK